MLRIRILPLAAAFPRQPPLLTPSSPLCCSPSSPKPPVQPTRWSHLLVIAVLFHRSLIPHMRPWRETSKCGRRRPSVYYSLHIDSCFLPLMEEIIDWQESGSPPSGLRSGPCRAASPLLIEKFHLSSLILQTREICRAVSRFSFHLSHSRVIGSPFDKTVVSSRGLV